MAHRSGKAIEEELVGPRGREDRSSSSPISGSGTHWPALRSGSMRPPSSSPRRTASRSSSLARSGRTRARRRAARPDCSCRCPACRRSRCLCRRDRPGQTPPPRYPGPRTSAFLRSVIHPRVSVDFSRGRVEICDDVWGVVSPAGYRGVREPAPEFSRIPRGPVNKPKSGGVCSRVRGPRRRRRAGHHRPRAEDHAACFRDPSSTSSCSPPRGDSATMRSDSATACSSSSSSGRTIPACTTIGISASTAPRAG